MVVRYDTTRRGRRLRRRSLSHRAAGGRDARRSPDHVVFVHRSIAQHRAAHASRGDSRDHDDARRAAGGRDVGRDRVRAHDRAAARHGSRESARCRGAARARGRPRCEPPPPGDQPRGRARRGQPPRADHRQEEEAARRRDHRRHVCRRRRRRPPSEGLRRTARARATQATGRAVHRRRSAVRARAVGGIIPSPSWRPSWARASG